MRFTSKLAHVVELNFTLGWPYTNGKQGIRNALNHIAIAYAQGSEPAFTVKKFTGPSNGSSDGLPNPAFNLEDLQTADVIVTNDVGSLNMLPSKSPSAASAFETAVRNGRSVLGFFGSGDGGTGWKFYSEEFFPLRYQHWGGQVPMPVYRNDAEQKHIVLQGIWDSGTTPMEAPMGIDSVGTNYLPVLHKYKGGNAYSFIIKVGSLTDLRGRLVAVKNGAGNPGPEIRGLAIAPGVYFLHIRSGKGPARINRYLVPPLSP